MHFGDTLVARVRALGHPLCVGLDPHLGLVPAPFRQGAMRPRDPATAVAVERFLEASLDRLAGRVAIVKPQIAFFEQLGAAGIAMLERIVARARAAGLLVLLDAKRGDMDSSAEGYALAYLDRAAGCEVDAITLNPYLGLDSLEPFAARAAADGRGLFVLVRTSNPGAADLQDQEVKGVPFYEVVARTLGDLAQRLLGSGTGWSSLGVVVGATWPEQSERVRAILPRALFLIPGYGAQGASAADAVRSFVPGPHGREGGVVSSSRGILMPASAMNAADASRWERAVDDAIARAIDELAEAIAR